VQGSRTKEKRNRSRFAVGMPVTQHPPHRSVREELPHTALTLGQTPGRGLGSGSDQAMWLILSMKIEERGCIFGLRRAFLASK